MKTWTDAAKECLDNYLAERAAKAGLTGEEAAEVMEDWRLHVHEEVEREAAPVISVEGLEPVLARLGKVDFVGQTGGGGVAEPVRNPQSPLDRAAVVLVVDRVVAKCKYRTGSGSLGDFCLKSSQVLLKLRPI